MGGASHPTNKRKQQRTERERERIVRGFWPGAAATYAVALEKDVQVLAGLAILVLRQRALVNGVLPVGFGTVTTVKPFLS